MIALGVPIADCCWAVGLNPSIYKRWMEEGADENVDPSIFKLRMDVRRFEARGVATSVKKLHDAPSRQAVDAHKFLLSKRRKAEFGNEDLGPMPGGNRVEGDQLIQIIAVLEGFGAKIPDDVRRMILGSGAEPARPMLVPTPPAPRIIDVTPNNDPDR